MNGIIEAKTEGSRVLLNPHAIAWVRPTCEDNVLIGMMAGSGGAAPFYRLDCSYDEFKLAWINALNYADEFGDLDGVISV